MTAKGPAYKDSASYRPKSAGKLSGMEKSRIRRKKEVAGGITYRLFAQAIVAIQPQTRQLNNSPNGDVSIKSVFHGHNFFLCR
jgi:hypothetical protein